jgi:hypothetical protein
MPSGDAVKASRNLRSVSRAAASALAHITRVDYDRLRPELGGKRPARRLEPDPRPVAAALAILDRTRVRTVIELVTDRRDERVQVIGMNVRVPVGPDDLVRAEAEEPLAVR